GHPAARPPAPLQRPQGQVRHLALPQPRRRPPAHRHHHHRYQHRYLQPTATWPHQQTPSSPPDQPLRPSAADPPPADHRHHHQPATTRLGAATNSPLLGVKPRN